jgi:type II restriction/modification system DNA methylase subunit YeeA
MENGAYIENKVEVKFVNNEIKMSQNQINDHQPQKDNVEEDVELIDKSIWDLKFEIQFVSLLIWLMNPAGLANQLYDHFDKLDWNLDFGLSC